MDYLISGSLVFSLFLAGALGYCDKYEIERCVQPITDLRQELGISKDLPYFPAYSLNEQQLDQYCVAGERVSNCFEDLSGCSIEEKKLFDGLLQATNYLCEETLEEYKSHQNCYAQASVIHGLDACSMEIKRQLDYLVLDPTNRNSKICSYVKQHYQCIKGVVEPECGKEAAEWDVEYVKKEISPMLSLINCNGIPKWLIYLLAPVGLIVLAIFIKLVTVVLRRKRSSSDNLQFNNVLSTPNQTPDASEQPPPYVMEYPTKA